ncbi:MAG: preprotein translocase subunit SecG [Syntrophobacteraceae bacterium]|nr:preprotein translocase subunit SecG [Syntrophobacteraceae bacterium]
MYSVLIVFHVIACFALILIVLLQTGRGAEMGAAFGGASQTLFGGSGGTTFLGKMTTAAAVLFMLTCLILSYLSAAPSTKSIMEDVPPVEKPAGPLLPDAKPVPDQPASSQAVPSPAETASPPSDAASRAQEGAANPAPAQTAEDEKKAAPAAKSQQKQADKPAAGKKP